jgi:hypothetical protein
MIPDDMLAQLEYLLDRQQIIDVIHTYARAMDRLDKELFLTTYHPDAVDDHAGFVGGREEFFDWAATMARRDREKTQHLIANHVVEIDGDTAHAETYWMAAGLKYEGIPFFMGGGRYLDRLVKEHGNWTIRERVLVLDWEMPAVNTREAVDSANGVALPHMSPAERTVAETRLRPSMDRNDPSYDRPYRVSEERLSASREARRQRVRAQ